MDFMTLPFLAFLAAAAVCYYCMPRVLKPVFLLAASYCFYLYSPQNRSLVWVLIGLTVVTWLMGFAIHAARNKILRSFLLCVSLLLCFSSLLYFKYLNLFFGSFFAQNGITFDIVQPLGLSYFLFQSTSYVIDLYKDKIAPECNPVNYALFVSFFPCIVTGPIERANHLLAQIHQPQKFNYSVCAGNAFRILWGYFKKIVLADNLAVFVSAVYSVPSEMNGPVLAAAALLFPIQLYMDFSGCCDIAIGGAGLFGFELLENFNNPFLAKNFPDLWRRWHMSLTGWFRDYVYFPLGGSRKGLLRYCLNLIVVFSLSGLWHGAAWGYLIWGFSCGLIQVVCVLLRKIPHITKFQLRGLIFDWVQRLFTYGIFSLTVVFFSSSLFGCDCFEVFRGMADNWKVYPSFQEFILEVEGLGLGGTLGIILFLGCTLVFFVESAGVVSKWIREQSWALRWPLYYGLACAILFYGAFGQSVFIYQRY